MDAWVDRELGTGEFPDQRLKVRLGKLLGDLGRRIGGTLPAACQDWAATKAAYRFFSNPRVDEGVILAGQLAATRARVAATSGPGSERVSGTHPERVCGAHPGFEDGRSGQGRQFGITQPYDSSSSSSTRGSDN